MNTRVGGKEVITCYNITEVFQIDQTNKPPDRIDVYFYKSHTEAYDNHVSVVAKLQEELAPKLENIRVKIVECLNASGSRYTDVFICGDSLKIELPADSERSSIFDIINKNEQIFADMKNAGTWLSIVKSG